jgi:hypothetical protein
MENIWQIMIIQFVSDLKRDLAVFASVQIRKLNILKKKKLGHFNFNFFSDFIFQWVQVPSMEL